MSRLLLLVLLLASFSLAACAGDYNSPTQPGVIVQTADANGPAPQFTIDKFVDYAPVKGEAVTATVETDSYSLINGGLHWNSGGAVEYQISGSEDVTGGNAAIVAGIGAYAGRVPRSFNNVGSAGNNPCGAPNAVSWQSIDGPGNVLAFTSTCRNVATKEIVGFFIAIDSDDDWSVGASDASKFDVQNIITHEMGHGVGLGHDNAPRDGCLTMFKFAALGEIAKRTLGLGDKLGLFKLYGLTETAAGVCGS
jgi:hypothetical protein